MAKQKDQLSKLRLPKKKIDEKDIEETTAKVYKTEATNPTRKTSFNLDERLWRQLKYISMSRGVSLREVVEPCFREAVKKNKDLLPLELK